MCAKYFAFSANIITGRLNKMSLFFYVTYKLVLLKDKRLGVLYYVLAVLALLYTVVEIFVRKGYMDVRALAGGVSEM